MEQAYGRNSYSKCVHMLTRESRVEKLVLRYVLHGWLQTNGTAKYTKASPQAMKMWLFSSIMITIILSYAIIRIYIILFIYLQVSKTEGLAELH